FVDDLIYGPWKDHAGRGFPLSAAFPAAARLPVLIPGTRVHLGFLLALAAAAAVAVVLGRTRWGFEIRVIGDNPVCARYAGIDLVRNTLLVMGLAGALAGLAGAGEASAIAGRLQRGLSPGYGYTGIIVAWLAKLNPIAAVLVAALLGGLLVGVEGMMLVGALAGFAATARTGNPWAGAAAAGLVGGCLGLIHALLTVTLRANQVASGLALTIFGTGVSAFLGRGYVGVPASGFETAPLPLLSRLPGLGPILFQQDPFVYLSFA